VNWSDEKYVKVYTRDTLTWLSLSWEARALLALLLRKVDGAGLMETGTLDLAQAVALQLAVPVDVARRALAELITVGTVTEVRGGILIPNFVEAQEATKTEARKKKDQRQRTADKRRLTQLVESPTPLVPQCPVPSRDVPDCPPPAQPTTTTSPPPPPPPAQPTTTTSPVAARSKKARQAELPAEIVPPKPPRAPGLVEQVHEYFLEARGYRLEDLSLDVAAHPDESPEWPRSAATVSAWASCAKADDARTQLSYAKSVVDEFLKDPFWAGAKRRVDGKDTDEPQPYPWRALLSEKVWRRHVEAVERSWGAAA